MVRDRAVIAAGLAQIEGVYRVAPAARNMLLLIAAVVLPLLNLMVVRLLGAYLPAVYGAWMAALLTLGAIIALAEVFLGAVHIDCEGAERYSPWPWWRWRISLGDISGLGTWLIGNGRYLVIESTAGRSYRLSFRPGFERVLSVIG